MAFMKKHSGGSSEQVWGGALLVSKRNTLVRTLSSLLWNFADLLLTTSITVGTVFFHRVTNCIQLEGATMHVIE